MTRKLVALLGLGGLGMMLAGCNTVHGFGQDMSAAGRGISNAVSGSSSETESSGSGSTTLTAANSPSVAAAPNQMVTVRQGSNVREEPSLSGKIVGHATSVNYRVYSKKGNWTQIGDANQAQGWVYDRLITPTS